MFIRNVKGFIWLIRMKILMFHQRLIGNPVQVGRNAVIGVPIKIARGREIQIGNNFFCGYGCHLGAPMIIEDNVMFAPNVAVVGGDHKIDNCSININQSGRDEFKTVKISEGAWVGYGATILHGVEIGRGAVVAAGSVITNDVPDFGIVAGNPAKLIRYRRRLKDASEE